MIKNDGLESGNLPEQIKDLTYKYKNNYKYINTCDDCFSKKSTPPNPKQTFLYNLWLRFESIQDQIKHQDSLRFQFFEFLNPILFNAWIKTGRR